MLRSNVFIVFFFITNLWLYSNSGFAQQVQHVPKAFEALSSEPEIIFIDNKINVPTAGGHLQGVQLIEEDGIEKLLISGSSRTKSYVLQADLATGETDQLITLMNDPFRHAGGFQISEPYLAVGIEDNHTKTISKVCLYNYLDTNLDEAKPNLVIEREGKPKEQTAGATGLLMRKNDYLMVVSNWDSRNWDFYSVDLEKNTSKLLHSFPAPDDWGSYQSINLIMDSEAIYAIGFYKNEGIGSADLILVSYQGDFKPIMKKIHTKTFNCKNGVDFATAVGLQVDKEGKLHIWGTQRDAVKEIVVNRFSEE